MKAITPFMHRLRAILDGSEPLTAEELASVQNAELVVPEDVGNKEDEQPVLSGFQFGV